MNKTYFYLALMLLLMCGIYYQYSNNETDKPKNIDLLTAPIFQSEQSTTSVFDVSGNLRYKIIAKKVQHYDNTNETLFQSPILFFYDLNNALAWQMVASDAKLTQDKKIYLQGNVIIDNMQSSVQLNKVTTPSLVVDSISEQFTTNDHVMIEGDYFVSKGIGLLGNLKHKTAQILKDVTSDYKKVRE